MRKSLLAMSLDERKIELIVAVYIAPADRDYLTARWAFNHGIFENFYWCGTQALEKYMKAMLLFLNENPKNFGHDILKLFKAISALDTKNQLPTKITLPITTGMRSDQWQGKPIHDFFKEMNHFGSTDNRYGIHGQHITVALIYILDTFCLACRHFISKNNFYDGQICEFLNELDSGEDSPIILPSWNLGTSLFLERLYLNEYKVGEKKALRKTFSNMNFAFFEEHSNSESVFSGMSIIGAPIENHLIRLKELGSQGDFGHYPENTEIIDELTLWVLENIQLPKELRKKLII